MPRHRGSLRHTSSRSPRSRRQLLPWRDWKAIKSVIRKVQPRSKIKVQRQYWSDPLSDPRIRSHEFHDIRYAPGFSPYGIRQVFLYHLYQCAEVEFGLGMWCRGSPARFNPVTIGHLAVDRFLEQCCHNSTEVEAVNIQRPGLLDRDSGLGLVPYSEEQNLEE